MRFPRRQFWQTDQSHDKLHPDKSNGLVCLQIEQLRIICLKPLSILSFGRRSISCGLAGIIPWIMAHSDKSTKMTNLRLNIKILELEVPSRLYSCWQATHHCPFSSHKHDAFYCDSTIPLLLVVLQFILFPFSIELQHHIITIFFWYQSCCFIISLLIDLPFSFCSFYFRFTLFK